MHDKEKRLMEHRQIEANRKGLLGMEGKFGTILKNLGHPIVSQSSGWHYATEMPDVWHIDEDDEGMPTFDEDETIIEIGLIFDGLSSGLHLEIKHVYDSKELKVIYKGFPVFCEINNELDCYVPFNEWEDKIDYLFGIAKKREQKQYEKTIIESKKEAKREKQSFLEKLKLRWGFK